MNLENLEIRSTLLCPKITMDIPVPYFNRIWINIVHHCTSLYFKQWKTMQILLTFKHIKYDIYIYTNIGVLNTFPRSKRMLFIFYPPKSPERTSLRCLWWMKVTHRIHVRCIYHHLPTLIPLKINQNVGKYISPMDPMGEACGFWNNISTHVFLGNWIGILRNTHIILYKMSISKSYHT